VVRSFSSNSVPAAIGRLATQTALVSSAVASSRLPISAQTATSSTPSTSRPSRQRARRVRRLGTDGAANGCDPELTRAVNPPSLCVTTGEP
jgi:hypothetical protein